MSAGRRPIAELRAAVIADHRAMNAAQERYHSAAPGGRPLLVDLVQRIGFQMLVAVRVMHLVRDLHIPFAPQVVSRLIRHMYAAEIHWDARLHPGIVVIHGNGIVISHGAEVKPGCIVFQGVTLGESIDPVTRIVGAPTVEENVHIGPNSVLLGPLLIGEGTKIMANVTLVTSVPSRSVVLSPVPQVTTRERSASGEQTRDGEG